MSEHRRTSISVDQFIAATPDRVWRYLTDPELFGRWWVPGDVSGTTGHRFELHMPGWGAVACEVMASDPPELLSFTFGPDWTLTWRLVACGTGTRLLFEHAGFDVDDPRAVAAFERMSGGWRSVILPALARNASASGSGCDPD